MPLYLTRRRDTDTIRVIDAPNNRAVLMHLAAEIFDVALAKVETVGEDGEAEPQRRRGRPPKAETPATENETVVVTTGPQPVPAAEPVATTGPQPPANEAPAASDSLIEAEAARAHGKPLYERMGALGGAAAEPKGE